jgi:SP family myo-inositol transporter-like MFS transporter 13
MHDHQDDFCDTEKSEQVEHVDTIEAEKGEVADLSSIEDTAASKAAWLISVTVSIGGLLFGISFHKA